MVTISGIAAAFRGLRHRFMNRLRSRYTRALEDEVARLRAENHALVNSILGVAGIPPMRAASAVAHTSAGLSQVAGAQSASGGATLGSPGRGKPRPYQCDIGNLRRKLEETSRQLDATRSAGRELQTAGEMIAPLRKRSWQQIGRVREIEDARAARRERESNTETFPTPRSIISRL
ncbi:MAG: hypothetical protein ACYDDI_15625 [Candidatus Acidiferrales bacterium]